MHGAPTALQISTAPDNSSVHMHVDYKIRISRPMYLRFKRRKCIKQPPCVMLSLLHIVLHYFQSTSHTHPFNVPLSGTTRVSRYQKGKTNLDFTEARDSEWQWHQLDHMQVCTSLQTDNYTSTPPLSFLQAGCPSCRPTNSVKALKANQSTSL